jgi:hypothetical protein
MTDNTKQVGYKQVVDTLTTIDKETAKQTFHTVNIPDYVDIDTGNQAYAETIAKNNVMHIGNTDDWLSFDTGAENLEVKKNDVELQLVINRRIIGQKEISFNSLDLKKLAYTGNFDEVEQKFESRKESADLLIQEIVLKGKNGLQGILNARGITVNTTAITKSFASMTVDEIRTAAANLVALYRANCNKTATPNRFIMPEYDYIQCCSSNDAQYQHKTRLGYMLECFEMATAGLGRKGDFKILPTAYADIDTGGANKGKYELYNKNSKSIIYDLPIPFTTEALATSDYMNFKSEAYLQVGEVRLLRPAEFLEFVNLNA